MQADNEYSGERALELATRAKRLALFGATRRGSDGRPDVVVLTDGTVVPGVRRVEKGNFYPFS